MRTNGTLSLTLNNGSRQQLNADGEPIFEEPEWTQPDDCFIQDIMEDRKAKYIDGGYTDVSYEVICEGEDIEADRVRLTRKGRELGEFDVKSIRETTMHRTIILV